MNDLKENQRLCGFIVTRVRERESLGGAFVEMTHEKSGASLCFSDNGEDNKLFCIGFKTLPTDSTGVFHILEHSVLCGSEKYPVREPFVELLKSSMKTFLNAMTYPDKTIYPVSSRNTADFMNLTSVYLDAVFAPAILKDKNIFYQEGHHVELDGDTPSYKGVVFNEMKGAMSGVDDNIEIGINSLLFPNNCYRFNSGGAPEEIPDLTYEQFIKTYKKHYHPSNALIYLDGDIPLVETLTLIDSYLSRFDAAPVSLDIEPSVSARVERTEYFEVAEGEDGENKAILTVGKLLCGFEDKRKLLAAKVLCNALADSNEAPLCRALLSSGLGEDLSLYLSDGIAQTALILQVRNMNDADSDKVIAIIRDTARSLIEGGLDRGALRASINRIAFRLRQTPEPQGLYRASAAFDSWLYGGDPMLYLDNEGEADALRAMLEDDTFEKLLAEMLLDDKVAILHMLPSATLGAEKREREAARLANELAAMSEDEKAELRREGAALALWQQTPDTAEQLATLPTLPLSQIGDMPELTRTELGEIAGVKLLYHPVKTSGITYISLYFSLCDLTLDELSAAALLPALFGELSTENYSVAALQQEIKTYIGAVSYDLGVHSRDGVVDKCTPCLTVRISVLDENIGKALELIEEVLLRTDLRSTDAIREIVLQEDEYAKQEAVMSGHSLAASAVGAHFSARGAVNEAIRGFSSIRYLRTLAKNFDGEVGALCDLLCRIQKNSLCRARLTASVTSSEPRRVDAIINALPEGVALADGAEYKTALPYKMGISVPAGISFAACGYHLSRIGERAGGARGVADKILSLDYLWNEVRVQGGAYGVGMQTGRDGVMLCYSYRDPSPVRTLGVFGKMAEHIEAFCDRGEEIDKYVISAVASTEPLATPAARGHGADERYFLGIGEAELSRRRAEMIATDAAALRAIAPSLRAMRDEGAVCVVGFADALKGCDGLEIIEL
ncbi:MAG: insulinase family protein [Clostridia bacterium]|nr:insulinase family protein [Clostridia bacterium]